MRYCLISNSILVNVQRREGNLTIHKTRTSTDDEKGKKTKKNNRPWSNWLPNRRENSSKAGNKTETRSRIIFQSSEGNSNLVKWISVFISWLKFVDRFRCKLLGFGRHKKNKTEKKFISVMNQSIFKNWCWYYRHHSDRFTSSLMFLSQF